MSDFNRTIDDIVETLRNAHAEGRGCSLLVGAGCSVSAGIPTAKRFVEIIKTRYRRAYDRAPAKTYPECMAQLAEGERRDLIARYVDAAKINWAHIGIAQLMKHGFVDRVLTTNFDLLVARACSVLGIHPAIYDFAASQAFIPTAIPERAVFYLHGQHTGFVLMNTAEQFDHLSKRLVPVFDDAGRGRVWIVVGYSGENDPVFDHLAAVPSFEYKLYWVCHGDSEPRKHVRKRLLVDGKFAYHVGGGDADCFFITLARKLGCWPPEFVGKPFSYLEGLLGRIAAYPICPVQSDIRFDVELMESAHKRIRAAKATYEATPEIAGTAPQQDISAIGDEAVRRFMAGAYEGVLSLLSEQDLGEHEELVDVLYWTYIARGNDYMRAAKKKEGGDADQLFSQALKWYRSAADAKPNAHEVLVNWAYALSEQARTRKEGAQANALFAEASEKYKEALAIVPTFPPVLAAWGSVLAEQAGTQARDGRNADDLFAQAYDKYKDALRADPDSYVALYNWGTTLVRQAKTKNSTEAIQLCSQAAEKLEAATKIRSESREAFNNWGATLLEQAKMAERNEANRLLKQAGEKFAIVLEIESNDTDALRNWANALSEQAKNARGSEADDLFELAYKKYGAALERGPDVPEVLNNWGAALGSHAEKKEGEEANRAFLSAEGKYEQSFRLGPDMPETLVDWGNVLSSHAKTKTGADADSLFALAGKKYENALALRPKMHEAFLNWGLALFEQASRKDPEEADKLLLSAAEKLGSALDIKPDMDRALNNLGYVLMERARRKKGEEASLLFGEAKRQLLRAESLAPGRSAYNLACLSALLGNEAECKEWLAKGQQLGALPPHDHVGNDSDLASVRHRVWFKEFLGEE